MAALLPTIAYLALAHALYSSYEFTHTKTHSLPFPRDIQLEVVFSVVVLLTHIFLLSGATKELSLVDNGRVLTSKSKLLPVLMKDAVAWDELKGGNAAFKSIETRVSYIDIVSKRREFEAWEKSRQDDGRPEKK